MAIYTPKRLSGPTNLSATTVTDFYTAVSGGSVVKQIVFTNYTTTAVVVSAYLTASGTAPSGTTGSFIYQLSVGPKSQIIWSADIPMSSGEHLWVQAGTSNAVNVLASGIEIS